MSRKIIAFCFDGVLVRRRNWLYWWEVFADWRSFVSARESAAAGRLTSGGIDVRVWK